MKSWLNRYFIFHYQTLVRALLLNFVLFQKEFFTEIVKEACGCFRTLWHGIYSQNQATCFSVTLSPFTTKKSNRFLGAFLIRHSPCLPDSKGSNFPHFLKGFLSNSKTHKSFVAEWVKGTSKYFPLL